MDWCNAVTTCRNQAQVGFANPKGVLEQTGQPAIKEVFSPLIFTQSVAVAQFAPILKPKLSRFLLFTQQMMYLRLFDKLCASNFQVGAVCHLHSTHSVQLTPEDV